MLASDNGVFSCAISKLLDRDAILFHQRAGQVGSAAEELLLAPLQSVDIDPAGNLTLGRQLLEGNSIQTADLLTFDQLANNSTKCLLKCPWKKSIHHVSYISPTPPHRHTPSHPSAFSSRQESTNLFIIRNLRNYSQKCHFALSSHRANNNVTNIFYNGDSCALKSQFIDCIHFFTLSSSSFFCHLLSLSSCLQRVQK